MLNNQFYKIMILNSIRFYQELALCIDFYTIAYLIPLLNPSKGDDYASLDMKCGI